MNFEKRIGNNMKFFYNLKIFNTDNDNLEYQFSGLTNITYFPFYKDAYVPCVLYIFNNFFIKKLTS